MKKEKLVDFIFEMIEKKDKKISKDTIIINKSDWIATQIQIKKELLK